MQLPCLVHNRGISHQKSLVWIVIQFGSKPQLATVRQTEFAVYNDPHGFPILSVFPNYSRLISDVASDIQPPRASSKFTLAGNILTKSIALNSALNDLLKTPYPCKLVAQNCHWLGSLFVLSLYGESLGGRVSVVVLSRIAPSDSSYRELHSGTQTVICTSNLDIANNNSTA